MTRDLDHAIEGDNHTDVPARDLEIDPDSDVRAPVAVAHVGTRRCPHSRRPDARPDRCSACLGVVALRIPPLSDDEVIGAIRRQTNTNRHPPMLVKKAA